MCHAECSEASLRFFASLANDIITLKCVNPVMLILELVVVAFPDLLNTIYLLRGLCKDTVNISVFFLKFM
jgi:hypothetical protein